jgi:hypothetical protein
MEDHIPELTLLVKKYQEQVEMLEKDLLEARRKLAVASEAIDLLKSEGNFQQQKLFEVPMILTERYKSMSMTDAIQDILRLHQTEKLSVDVIHSELINNGFTSGSQDLKRDVYTRVFRLEKKGKLNSSKKGKVKRYFLPKQEEEKNEETIT